MFEVGNIVVCDFEGELKTAKIVKIWNGDFFVLESNANVRWTAHKDDCFPIVEAIRATAAHSISEYAAMNEDFCDGYFTDINEVYSVIKTASGIGLFCCQFPIYSQCFESYKYVIDTLENDGYNVDIKDGSLEIYW